MLVGKEYKIESDSLNVTLFKRRKAKQGKNKGKMYWDTIGYHSTIKYALRQLVNLAVKETELKDLATVVKKQDELNKMIEGLNA